MLTRIEMRINKMLTEYEVEGFSMMREVAAPKHVDDLEPKPVLTTAEQAEEEERWKIHIHSGK